MINDYRLMAMNNPFQDLRKEVYFMKKQGLKEMELTIEPPQAYFKEIQNNINMLRGFCNIGHTRGDFEFASDNAETREKSIQELKAAIDLFRELKIKLVSLHPHNVKETHIIKRKEVERRNIDALKEVCIYAKPMGIEILIENQRPFALSEQYHEIFEAVPEAGLLLDIAHAYCWGGDKNVNQFISEWGEKIKHVHISDNDGEEDDHLFVGEGRINFKKYLTKLHQNSSVRTISLEPFMIRTKTNILRIATEEERKKHLARSITSTRKILEELDLKNKT